MPHDNSELRAVALNLVIEDSFAVVRECYRWVQFGKKGGRRWGFGRRLVGKGMTSVAHRGQRRGRKWLRCVMVCKEEDGGVASSDFIRAERQ